MLGLQLNGKATGRRLRVRRHRGLQPEVRQSPAQDPTRIFEQFLLVGRLCLEVRAGHATQPPELEIFQNKNTSVICLEFIDLLPEHAEPVWKSKFYAASVLNLRVDSTPSTRRLLDSVAMPIPRRSTGPARPRHRREMTS